MEYISLDLETTIKKSYKRTANPLNPENRIIAIGTKVKDEEAHGEYIDWGLGDGPGVQDLEITKEIIVGYNIKFDLLYLWGLPGIQKFIQRGGKIWDTQLAEYYLTAQQTKWYNSSLRDLAVNQYSCPERTKWIEYYLFDKVKTLKELMESINSFGSFPNEECNKLSRLYKQVRDCLEMQDVPQEKVLEDVKNDVLDTEQIYLEQYKKATELQMLPLLETVMNELLMTTETEYNGIYVNQEIFRNNKYD